MLGYQRALLERRGFAVLTAASARQGLQIAAACAVAAVIVDYHMPEMNGHELATEIKRLRPEVPIVMVSSDDEIAEYALKVVDAFVSKNEAPSRLLPVITRICGETFRRFQETRITAWSRHAHSVFARRTNQEMQPFFAAIGLEKTRKQSRTLSLQCTNSFRRWNMERGTKPCLTPRAVPTATF